MSPKNHQDLYPCVTFGELRIPYFPLFEDVERGYTEEEVKRHVNNKVFTIPDEKVRKYHEKTIKMKEREARKMKKVFFDGPLVRLNDYKTDFHEIELYLQRTSFFSFVSTNKSLDNDLVWKMVEKRGKEYTNLNDGLANPIGCNLLTLTSDGYVIMNKRSNKISQYPELYGILPAGFCDPERDEYNPFNTVKREGKEEIGVEIKEPKLLGFGRAGDDRHIEFLFFGETDYKSQEIKSTPKPGKYEMKELILSEFEPKKLAPYIVKTVNRAPKGAVERENVWVPGRSPTWVPAQVYGVILALIKEYGFDQTHRAINDVYHELT